MKTIVVPWDGERATERAVPIAAAMARRVDADVLVVMVTSLPDLAEPELDRLVEKCDGDGRVRTEAVRSEDVVGALSDVVAQTSQSVLCMVTHARGRVSGAFLGGVGEALLHRVQCPVVLVGPSCSSAWPQASERLLACLDSSVASEAIVTPAAQWAAGLGLELWFARIFDPLDADDAAAAPRFLDTVVERVRPDMPNAKACVAWNRHVPGEILHLAHTLDASMIAMATHGKTGLARLALGSVAMTVTHEARCPVLTVRPTGLTEVETTEASERSADTTAHRQIHLPPGVRVGGGPESEAPGEPLLNGGAHEKEDRA